MGMWLLNLGFAASETAAPAPSGDVLDDGFLVVVDRLINKKAA